MSNDIFTEPTAETKPVTPAVVTVNDLVGEGKKFASVDDLAKAKATSDAFIQQLQEELKGLREAVIKQNNAEENLRTLQTDIAEMKAKQNSKADEPSPQTTGELTTEKLEEIVSGVITKQEQSRTANQNLNTANSEMVRQFGSVDKAQEVFKQKAAELNMTLADLKALAAKSPTAFFSIMKLDTTKKTDKKVDLQNSNVNTSVLPIGSGMKQGTAAYYNSIRRERGNAAFFADIKLQQEIFQAKMNGTYDS